MVHFYQPIPTKPNQTESTYKHSKAKYNQKGATVTTSSEPTHKKEVSEHTHTLTQTHKAKKN